MKKFFTLTVSVFCVLAAFAQTDDEAFDINDQINPERTSALEVLYQEADALDETGTAAQIEANRISIKNEWATVDPAISALYRPINAPTYDRLGQGPTPYIPSQIIIRPDPLPMNRDWGTDILIRNDFVDGVDMEVTQNTGDIYVGMYDNVIDAGGTVDDLYIYKSIDDGKNWSLFAQQTAVTPIRKMQLISLDGTGTNYILAYIMFEGGLFQVARWDMSNAAFDFDTVQTGVSDFGVDRNYPTDTATMRVLATYQKDDACVTEVFSARSTTGSHGFGWMDEVSLNVCAQQIDFTYARAGDAFVTYTGASTGNLYVNSNDSFNDPASWTPRETIVQGSVRETLNPTIRAARLEIGVDKVIIWGSDRASGSTTNFDGIGYLRENGGAFAMFSGFPSGGANWSVAHTDGWVRKETGVDILRMSYVRDNIDNSGNDLNRSLTFNGGISNFDPFEPVADGPIDVFDGFPSATAETSDNMPCLAFAGTNGTRGFGLYYDAKTVLSIQDNQIDGLAYYPNPTRESITVSAVNEISNITVYTILGKAVIELTPNNNKVVVQTSALASGLFVMKVTSGTQTASYKIMKN